MPTDTANLDAVQRLVLHNDVERRVKLLASTFDAAIAVEAVRDAQTPRHAVVVICNLFRRRITWIKARDAHAAADLRLSGQKSRDSRARWTLSRKDE